ncbi:hypothetical protein BH10ACI2_BH10ACI2_24610 [soil metagenome]
MLKFTTTLLVTIAILSFPLSQPLFSQAKAEDNVKIEASQSPEPKPDLKKVISENEESYRQRTASVDVKELEKLNRQTPKAGGWTTKEKVWLALGIVGVAALVFVLIKYYKKCLRSDPPNCTVGVDEICTCLEYEQKS